MRLYALYILVTFLVAYAWKDWFKSLCGLIVMMAVMEHEDMPKSIFGIQGFNMWNLLFLGVFIAWLGARRREGLKWDMPRHINVLLVLYLGVVVIGFLRAFYDRSYIGHIATSSLISDELINTIKWVLPGLLLFDGCRSRKRLQWAVVSILSMYFLLAVQVVKRMPWSSALGGNDPGMQRVRLSVCKDIGYSAPNISTFLAGASWAMLAAIPLVSRRKHKFLLLGMAGITAFGQALTGGRAGYMAWAATGLIMCMIKWRKYLLLAPVVPILLFIALPGAMDRMMFGFGKTDVSGEEMVDDYEVTSGRTLIWPHVIDKIEQSPVIGYGRLGMPRIGLTEFLGREYGKGDAFPHPHNMYLQWLLDNGVVGFIPVIMFFFIVIASSSSLFRSPDPWCSAVGGICLPLVLAQLIAGLGSQYFYPTESTMGMWTAIFLMLRVRVERLRASNAIAYRMSLSGLQQPRVAALPQFQQG